MCKVEGCFSKLKGGLGYCSKHYQRVKRYGDPNGGIKPHGTMEERFWRFVEKTDECWVWTGQKIRGYGRLSVGAKEEKSVGAHRFSWELHNKQKIPDGKFVMHSCDNPSCVNPDHLSIGSPKENYDDMVLKGRRKVVAPKGVANGKSILDEEKVRFIKTCGLNHAKTAKILGVSVSCVRGVRSGRTWSQVVV
jgi:hypothetical protein